MSFPVVGEFWTIFEQTLLHKAKQLTEDIAKREGNDPKELWKKIKPMIRVGICEAETDELPLYCSFPIGTKDTAVFKRCRAPCLLGHSACADHVHKPVRRSSVAGGAGASTPLPFVDRIIDHENKTYFVTQEGIAMDELSRVKGCVVDEVLYLFEKSVSQ